MAGAGFKDFTIGEVLTSADVDQYLMQQTVMKFADSAARGSALGTAVGAGTALAEGMLSYLDDIDEVQFFDGSAWARVGLPIGTAVPASGNVLVYDGGSSEWVPRSGSVLQVIQATHSTLVTITATSYTDTDLTATITPLYSTSKVLAIVHMAAEVDAGANNSWDFTAAITRTATQVCEWRVTAASFGGSLASTYVNAVLDSPATTSATTYKAQVKSNASGRTWRAQDNSATSTITLMEIAG